MIGRLALATLAASVGLALLIRQSEATAAEPTADAERVIDQVRATVPDIQKHAVVAVAPSVSAEARVAAGELSLRNRDWERAIQTFCQVKELYAQGKAAEPAKVDAEFMLGEAYLRSDQYRSAQREFMDIARNGARAPYDAYAGRALSRLVDIALRANLPGVLESIDSILATLPASDASGSMPYARAKFYYAKSDFGKAREAVAQVPAGSAYVHQAQYLLGVVMTKEARPSATESQSPSESSGVSKNSLEQARHSYSAAIEQFRAVTRLPTDTAERRHVVDLAWMAIGRLQYESGNMLDSVDAYSHIDRTSPEFSTMLYELAWVYAQLGDYQKAQRALEVLSITDPQKLDLSDGSLLRADLMLRSGQFDKALALYQGVKERFEPMREEVDQFIHNNSDSATYYDQLVSDVPELGQARGTKLSPIVVTWVREEAENNRTLSVIDDVARSRDLVKRSRRLVSQLTALLSSSTRANAFPEMKAAIENALVATNRISSARVILANGLDQVARSDVSGELKRVRTERRSLMKRMGQLPLLPADFMRRTAAGETQWNLLSQQLQRLTLEVDRLQAIINGLSRVMKESDQQGIKIDPASRQRFLAEIQANEQDLNGYRERINSYRDAVDMGRVQNGLGDSQYIDDARVRARFRELITQEMDLVTRGGDSNDAMSFARAAQPVLVRAAEVDGQIESILHKMEADTAAQAQRLQSTVVKESDAIEQNARQLEDLDQQARLLVGVVAMKNFAQVSTRLKGVVLRADVGIVQQAWEVREEQRTRVVNLQRERAREEQNLNDELREVLDDAEGAL